MIEKKKKCAIIVRLFIYIRSDIQMLFNSLEYLYFFIIVVSLYFLLQSKYRWIWLLISSYYFYMCWNPKYALLLLLSTIITYLSGIFIENIANSSKNNSIKLKQKKWVLTLSLISNLSILFIFKYFNFFNTNISILFKKLDLNWSVSNFNLILPVGISFYTFQALSYSMDVYSGRLKAQRNFGKYALFVSFFPQMVAGPIERSTNLISQLDEKFDFDYLRIKKGLYLILWGLFKKVVIADRVAAVVNTIYNNPSNHSALEMIIATIFFSIQIYCDFSSYSDIAIGSAQVMGYRLMQNFDTPYFAASISEFWRKWHISLSTWFRDYLYIPLGGSKVSKLKKYRNLMIVFLVSGIWHGANWTFIVWGVLHGFFQIIENELKLLNKQLGIKIHKFIKILLTIVLVSFAWIFFRANNIDDALYIIKNIFNFSTKTFESKNIGLDNFDLIIASISIVILLFVDYYNFETLSEKLSKSSTFKRWSIYIILTFSIIIFGYYGDTVAKEFIYFQF